MDFGTFGNGAVPLSDALDASTVQIKECKLYPEYTALTLWDGAKELPVRLTDKNHQYAPSDLEFALVTFGSVMKLSDRVIVKNLQVHSTPEECECTLQIIPTDFEYSISLDQPSPSNSCNQLQEFTSVKDLSAGDYSSIKLVLVSIKKPYASQNGKKISYIVAADSTGTINGAIFEETITRLRILEFSPGEFVEFQNVSIKSMQKQYQRWATSPYQLKFSATSAIQKTKECPRMPPLATLHNCLQKPALALSHGFLALLDSAKSKTDHTIALLIDHTVSAPVEIKIEIPMAEICTDIYSGKLCLFMFMEVLSNKALLCKNQKGIFWIDKGSQPAHEFAQELVKNQYIDTYNFFFTPLQQETVPPIASSSASRASVKPKRSSKSVPKPKRGRKK